MDSLWKTSKKKTYTDEVETTVDKSKYKIF